MVEYPPKLPFSAAASKLSLPIERVDAVANLPPYMNSVGLIPRIFEKMSVASKPARFTQDFLGTKLGFSSGSAKPFIPLLKRIGMLQPDGTPTELYAKLRNPSEKGAAMAEGLRIGYPTVFERNEYAGSLPRDKLTNLIIEITGLTRDNATLKAIVGTFFALAAFADFEAKAVNGHSKPSQPEQGNIQRMYIEDSSERTRSYEDSRLQGGDEVGLNLAYTINLNLPESTNPEVFNAIFKALREHLLKK